MSYRFLTAASLFAVLTACSSQGPSAVDPLTQGQNAYLSGDYGTAEAAYARVLDGNPSNGTALLGLAEVYEQTGRTAQAIEIYERIQTTRTGSIRVWNAGGVTQDGITEVAARRLGVLGMASARSVAQAPVAYTPPRQTTYAAPVINQGYATEQRTVIYTGDDAYYADQAPRSIQAAVPQTYTAPAIQTAPVVQSYAAPAPVTYTAPVAVESYALPAAPAPAPIQESYSYGLVGESITPAIQSTYVPEPVDEVAQPDPWTYALDDDGNISYGTSESIELPATELYTAPPAPVNGYEFTTPQPAASDLYDVEPAYEFGTPGDGAALYSPIESQIAYESDPIDPTAVLTPDYNRFRAAPAESAAFPVAIQTARESAELAAAATLQQPGYTVVDGDFVYISADQLKRSGAASAPAASSYEYDLETMNGFPGIDLN